MAKYEGSLELAWPPKPLCLAATKGACANHLLVRRTLAEKVIIDAVRGRLTDASTIRYVLRGVESAVKHMYSDVSETTRLKDSEL